MSVCIVNLLIIPFTFVLIDNFLLMRFFSWKKLYFIKILFDLIGYLSKLELCWIRGFGVVINDKTLYEHVEFGIYEFWNIRNCLIPLLINYKE